MKIALLNHKDGRRNFKYVNKDTLILLFRAHLVCQFMEFVFVIIRIFSLSTFFLTFEVANSNILKFIISVPSYVSSQIMADIYSRLLLNYIALL